MGKKFEDLTASNFHFSSLEDLKFVAKLYQDYKKRELSKARKQRLGKDLVEALKKELGYSYALNAVARLARPQPFAHWDHARRVLEQNELELNLWDAFFSYYMVPGRQKNLVSDPVVRRELLAAAEARQSGLSEAMSDRFEEIAESSRQRVVSERNLALAKLFAKYGDQVFEMADKYARKIPEGAVKSLVFMGNKHFPQWKLTSEDVVEFFSGYVDGELKKERDSSPPLSEEEKERLMSDMVKLLKAADKDGVVHDVRKALLDDDDEEKHARRRAAVKRSLEKFELARSEFASLYGYTGTVTVSEAIAMEERSQRLKRFYEELLSIEDLDEREVRRQQLQSELSSRQPMFPREEA